MKVLYWMLSCILILGCTAANYNSDNSNMSDFLNEVENNEEIIDSIQAVMIRQENAWNEGAIDQFMIGYWESDSLKFIGKTGLNYGWEKTLLNYKKSYPSVDEMGILHFNNLSIDVLSENIALVIGEWKLQRDKLGDTLQGHYSLIWRRIGDEWVIISDHSS